MMSANFSTERVLSDAWVSVAQFLLSPAVLISVAVGVAFILVVGILKRVLVARSRRMMWRACGSPAANWSLDVERAWVVDSIIRARIDRRLEMSWTRLVMAFRHPYAHTALWYLSGPDSNRFVVVTELSKEAWKFGPHLVAMAWKTMKDNVDDPMKTWMRLMTLADRTPEEHERLAAPGYSMAECIISVEHDIPLEYAEAMCSSTDQLSLVAA